MDLLIGDFVRHKEGGPAMTLVSIVDQTATCIWWDELQRIYVQRDFPLESLEAVTARFAGPAMDANEAVQEPLED
ncbi:MAG: DUF2158 domain-containing protein [Acidobacteria bacterium]|nr:DUF2158 domain-containing protein [Acidobacteriota bacterium]